MLTSRSTVYIEWHRAVSYCVESIWQTQITWRNLYENRKYFNFISQWPRQTRIMYKKKQVENLVWCPFKKDTEKSHESAHYDSAQYHTARNLTPCSIILGGTPEKYEYLGESETKNQTILTHWSVAQAGSNDEKNWGSKIWLDCPFKKMQFWKS